MNTVDTPTDFKSLREPMKVLLDDLMEQSVETLVRWSAQTCDPLLASQAVLTVLVNVIGNYAASAQDPIQTVEQLRQKSLDCTLHYLVQTSRGDVASLAAKLVELGAISDRTRMN